MTDPPLGTSPASQATRARLTLTGFHESRGGSTRLHAVFRDATSLDAIDATRLCAKRRRPNHVVRRSGPASCEPAFPNFDTCVLRRVRNSCACAGTRTRTRTRTRNRTRTRIRTRTLTRARALRCSILARPRHPVEGCAFVQLEASAAHVAVDACARRERQLAARGDDRPAAAVDDRAAHVDVCLLYTSDAADE